MSLDSVTVDCKNSTNTGQIRVAVGRVKSTEGLMVKNFLPSLCRPHPKGVDFYYESCAIGQVHENLSCCKIQYEFIDENNNSDASNEKKSSDGNKDDDDNSEKN